MMKLKTKSSLLFLLLITLATYTQAQSKSKLENSLANCTVEKDSIQKALIVLSATYDSLNTSYTTMYKAIKEKVFKSDFDPSKMPDLIDSLQTKASFGNIVLNDSISSLNKENAELIKLLKSQESPKVDKSEVIKDLKQLKELLDAKILTQKEFDIKKAVLLEKL